MKIYARRRRRRKKSLDVALSYQKWYLFSLQHHVNFDQMNNNIFALLMRNANTSFKFNDDAQANLAWLRLLTFGHFGAKTQASRWNQTVQLKYIIQRLLLKTEHAKRKWKYLNFNWITRWISAVCLLTKNCLCRVFQLVPSNHISFGVWQRAHSFNGIH